MPKYGDENCYKEATIGSLTWINAVAMITPEPKYFAIKNANLGTLMRSVLAR